MYWMRIVYFDTLYSRESSMNVFGEINFENGEVKFASGGHKYAIPVEQMIRIEKIGD